MLTVAPAGPVATHSIVPVGPASPAQCVKVSSKWFLLLHKFNIYYKMFQNLFIIITTTAAAAVAAAINVIELVNC